MCTGLSIFFSIVTVCGESENCPPSLMSIR